MQGMLATGPMVRSIRLLVIEVLALLRGWSSTKLITWTEKNLLCVSDRLRRKVATGSDRGSGSGEVPEWPIGSVSKTDVAVTSPRVRIPPSPLERQMRFDASGVFSCAYAHRFSPGRSPTRQFAGFSETVAWLVQSNIPGSRPPPTFPGRSEPGTPTFAPTRQQSQKFGPAVLPIDRQEAGRQVVPVLPRVRPQTGRCQHRPPGGPVGGRGAPLAGVLAGGGC